LLHKTVIPTFASRLALLNERDTFVRASGQIAEAIPSIEKRRDVVQGLSDIAPLVGDKYEKSLTMIVDGLSQIVPFSRNEVPAIVNRRVGRVARVARFLIKIVKQ
jgi:hypothetical protein